MPFAHSPDKERGIPAQDYAAHVDGVVKGPHALGKGEAVGDERLDIELAAGHQPHGHADQDQKQQNAHVNRPCARQRRGCTALA